MPARPSGKGRLETSLVCNKDGVMGSEMLGAFDSRKKQAVKININL